MKRFAWLWGVLLGAVLLPSLMVTSGLTANHFIVTPPWIIFPESNFSELLRALPYLLKSYALWSAPLGLFGAQLWIGKRTFGWRLLSFLVGAGTLSHCVWHYLVWWQRSSLMSPAIEIPLRVMTAARMTPMIIAASALVFFALLLRARPLPAIQR